MSSTQKEELEIVDLIKVKVSGQKPLLLWYVCPELVDQIPFTALEDLTNTPKILSDIHRLQNGGLLMTVHASACSVDELEALVGGFGAFYGITPTEVV